MWNRPDGQKIGFITPLSHNFCENCKPVVEVTVYRRDLYVPRSGGLARSFAAPLAASEGDALLEQAIRGRLRQRRAMISTIAASAAERQMSPASVPHRR
jgi:molybdenum cofactor biosynthesis enzyme MoaA